MSASSVAQNDPIGDEDFHDFSENGKSIEIQDIHEHAASGDWVTVTRILQDPRVNVNDPIPIYRTLLHAASDTASHTANLEMVQYLISHGANIETRNSVGSQPLHNAVRSEQLDVIRALVENHADVNGPGESGHTPLDMAISRGNATIVRFLLSERANANTQDTNLNTPLHEACQLGNQAVVDVLIQFGANVNSGNNSGRTPLFYAASGKHLNVVKSLISHHARIDQTDIWGKSALHSAAASGSLDVVKYLLEKGANDNIRSNNGDVAAQSAAQNFKFDVLRYFLEEVGVRRDIDWRETAFSIASEGFRDELGAEIIDYLIDNRLVSVDCRDSDESTLLHKAADLRSKFTVKILLERNANPIARDRNGKTVLDVAWAARWKWPISVIQRFALQFDPTFSIYLTSLEKKDFRWLEPFAYNSRESRLSWTVDQLGDKDWFWAHMSANDDACFTSTIIEACALERYDKDSTMELLQFFSSSFLEQRGSEPRLKFREPSYNTFTKELKLGHQDKVASNDKDSSYSYQSFSWLPDLLHPPADEASGKQQGEGTSKQGEAPAPSRGQFLNLRIANAVSIVLPCFDSRPRLPPVKLPESSQEYPQSNGDRSSNLPATNVHTSRTLDEFYYPGLSGDQLSRRNDDQVVSRMAKAENKTERLLLVPQLWLWKLDNIIISAFPGHSADACGSDEFVVERLRSICEKFTDLDSHLLTALILSEYIILLDHSHIAALQEPIFYTFEKAVANTFDKVQTYMRKEGMENININKEKDFMHSINDIREELTMIRSVIVQQKQVWDEFWDDSFGNEPEVASKRTDLWEGVNAETRSTVENILKRPKKQIATFLSHIDKIDKDAERVKEWILEQLDLKSKHAGLKEAHNSLILSTVVIGFTVVTVIFTPLSFLTSLFALPSDQLQKHHNTIVNGTAVYSNNYLGGWMTLGELASLFITAVAVWLSFIWLKFRGSARDSPGKELPSTMALESYFLTWWPFSPNSSKAYENKEMSDRVWAKGVTVETKNKSHPSHGKVFGGFAGEKKLLAPSATASPIEFIKGIVTKREKKITNPEC